MKKTLRGKLNGYIMVAFIYSIILTCVSFFVIYTLSTSESADSAAFLRGYIIFLIIFYATHITGALFIFRDMKTIFVPIQKIGEQAQRISEGKSIVRYRHNEDNELGDLALAVNNLLDYMNYRTEILARISEGDYSMHLEPLGEVDKLSYAIISVINTNNAVLREIKKAAHDVSEVSGQIARGAHSLASGSSEQAATLEQFSAVMEEVQEMANQNAGIAKDTLEKAAKSKELMDVSGADIERMNIAMDSMTASSHRIETVIKVIDDMAFQTNILALNAAVEAARAGAHGKGFAVVADEVRELASKSAAAARETSELIQTSIQNVNEGNAIVKQTAESLTDLGVHASSAAENMDRLSEASEQQRQAITEINRGINQLSNVVQSNSAMAQENSTSAHAMSDQADNLERLVARFTLKDN